MEEEEEEEEWEEEKDIFSYSVSHSISLVHTSLFEIDRCTDPLVCFEASDVCHTIYTGYSQRLLLVILCHRDPAAFGFAGLAFLRTSADHRRSRYWGGSSQSPESRPGRLLVDQPVSSPGPTQPGSSRALPQLVHSKPQCVPGLGAAL